MTTWHEALVNGQAYTRFKHYTIPDRKGNSGVSHDRLSLSSTSSAYDSSIASPTSDPGSPVPDDYPVVDRSHSRKPYSPLMENKSTSPPKSARKPRRDGEKEPARRDRRQESRSKSPSKKLRSTSKNLRNYNADREAKEEYLASRSPPDH